MKLPDLLRGLVTVELYAAFPESVLNASAREKLQLKDLERRDACTLRFSLPETQLPMLQNIARRQQAELRLEATVGGSRSRAALRRRPALLLSLLLALGLLLWSNFRIWEIELRGCETLSEGQVLRALEECGVSEGSYWPGLDQDRIRSTMLLKLPELAWMTVNVSGSRAVVSLVERAERPEIYRETDAADLVASRSGIVAQMTVLSGRPLVRAGSAVTEGETLVTGALDSLSHPTRTVRARGSVLAETWYEQVAAVPAGREKTAAGRTLRRFALRIGKTRLNFYAGSKKELDGYDKIVHEYRLGVKGLFALPLSLICESWEAYESGAAATTPEEAQRCAGRLRETLEEAIEGEILQFHVSFSGDGALRYVTACAHCLENIAETAEMGDPITP